MFDWVNENLAQRITKVKSMRVFLRDWDIASHADTQNSNEFASDSAFTETGGVVEKSSSLRVLILSQSRIPPTFLSVLSVKFTGRVQFGLVNTNSATGQRIAEHLNVSANESAKYVIVKPAVSSWDRGWTYEFGAHRGEHLSYNSFALFLNTLHPEVNDLFLASLLLVNVLWLFEWVTSRPPGRFLGRCVRHVWTLLEYNFLLIILWLPLLAVFQLPFMSPVLDAALSLLQSVALSDLASLVRADCLWFATVDCRLLVTSFVAFVALVALAHKQLFMVRVLTHIEVCLELKSISRIDFRSHFQSSDRSNDFSDFWNLGSDSEQFSAQTGQTNSMTGLPPQDDMDFVNIFPVVFLLHVIKQIC